MSIECYGVGNNSFDNIICICRMGRTTCHHQILHAFSHMRQLQNPHIWYIIILLYAFIVNIFRWNILLIGYRVIGWCRHHLSQLSLLLVFTIIIITIVIAFVCACGVCMNLCAVNYDSTICMYNVINESIPMYIICNACRYSLFCFVLCERIISMRLMMMVIVIITLLVR